MFLEKGLRGGVSCILKRYSKSDEYTDIMHWDLNNLYETVMSFEYLPYEDFRFLSEEEIKVFDIYYIHENRLTIHILVVDLKYPEELHNLHNDYLLRSEEIEVNYDMMSNFCKEIVDWYSIKVGGVKKLIPNLNDKVEYTIHYKNLHYSYRWK